MNDLKQKCAINKEFKDKWLTALRSGEYEQGREQLYTASDNTYCCLGVACHLINPEIIRDFGGYGFPSAIPESRHSELPDILLEDYFTEEVAAINDSGVTFEHIADWIERNTFTT